MFGLIWQAITVICLIIELQCFYILETPYPLWFQSLIAFVAFSFAATSFLYIKEKGFLVWTIIILNTFYFFVSCAVIGNQLNV